MYTWKPVIHLSSDAVCAWVCLPLCVCVQIYRILGKTVVCYPIVFDLSDFYLSQDVMLLIDDIKVSQGTRLKLATATNSLLIIFYIPINLK